MTAALRISKPSPVPAERRRLLARLHQLKKRLGLDDDTYRDALYAMCQRRSAGDMTDSQILETLNAWSRRLPDNERGPFTSGLRAPSKLKEPYQRLIKALWINLYNLGALSDGSDKALDAFVKRQAGVEALSFVRAHQAPALVEALKDWLRRDGLDFGDEIDGHAARVSLVIRQWAVLFKLRAVQLSFREALESWATQRLKLGRRGLNQLSEDQLDTLARDLGDWIRKVKRGAKA